MYYLSRLLGKKPAKTLRENGYETTQSSVLKHSKAYVALLRTIMVVD